LSICDNGKFEVSNLNRQICFEEDVGKFKIEVTEIRLKKINPKVEVIKSREFDSSNVSALLKDVSLAVLTLDDPIVSIAIARECFKRKIPLLESWGIPFLWAWWFTAEGVDYETCYGFKTKKLTVDEITNSPEIVFDIKLKVLNKLRQFPEVQERYNREKGTIRGIASGKLPFVSIAPVVRITASYLAYEAIFAGIIKAKKMVLAPRVIGYDYFNMKEINLE
jgi:DNA-binding Lrp family transcriptional regulator